MSSQIILDYEAGLLRKEVPQFQPGDTVRVSVKITEGDKERLQDFEGVVIRRKGGGVRETFTVRRVSYGVGMERIFPLHSPKVDAIKVVRRGKVRRSKLYYLRELRGKKARIVERKGIEGLALPTAQPAAIAEAQAAPAVQPEQQAQPVENQAPAQE